MRYSFFLLRNSILFLLPLLALAACGEDDVAQTEEGDLVLGATEVEAVSERGVVPGDRALVLDGFHGRITLEGVPDSTATLTFSKHARAADDAQARELLERVSVEERGGDDAYHYVMRSEVPERSSIHVRGRVPADVPLRVRMESGAVELNGVEGPVTVDLTNGNVQVSGAVQPVQVTTQNGNVVVGLRAVPSGETVSLATANGDVSVELPGDASTQIDARTEAGDIRAQGLAFENRRLDRQGAGARFRATLGTGQGTLEMRTQNGSIRLEEGTGEAPLLEAEGLEQGDPNEAIEEGLAPRDPIAPRDSARPADPIRGDTL